MFVSHDFSMQEVKYMARCFFGRYELQFQKGGR